MKPTRSAGSSTRTSRRTSPTCRRTRLGSGRSSSRSPGRKRPKRAGAATRPRARRRLPRRQRTRGPPPRSEPPSPGAPLSSAPGSKPTRGSGDAEMAAPSRWASQAAIDALLRFSPQKQALAEQITQAKGVYNASVKAGRVAARETEGSVARNLPRLAAAYGQADVATKPGLTLISNALAQLPPDTAQYRANQAAAGQTFLANLAAARADAQKTMLERGAEAAAGAQYNQRAAGEALTSSLRQLFSKQQSLASEAGLFAQTEAQKLEHEAADIAQRERGSQRTAQTAKEGREQKAREHQQDKELKEWEHLHPTPKAGAGAGEWLTPVEHNSARDTIEKIRREAYEHRNEGLNYDQSKSELERSVPASVKIPEKDKAGNVVRDSTGKVKEKTVQVPNPRGAYAYNGLLKAGLDLAYFGAIGTGTAGLLHREHLNVGRLGYPMYRAPSASSRARTNWEGLARAVAGIPRV